MIAQINIFIYNTFKCKATLATMTDLDHLKPEFKKLNIPIPPKNMPLTSTFIRTKEFLSQTKCQLMQLLCSTINESNGGFEPKKCENTTMRYFVGRGNNNHIVKAMLRSRFFGNWIFKDKTDSGQEGLGYVEETPMDDVNFIWT